MTPAASQAHRINIGDDEFGFVAKVVDHSDCVAILDVEVITSIGEENGQESLTTEPYLSCSIKWDGCSHFYFGEPNEKGVRDGYLHICGPESFKKHAALMEILYRLAFKVMGVEPWSPWEGRKR